MSTARRRPVATGASAAGRDVNVKSEGADKLQVYKDLLYDAVQANGTDERLYTQTDLLELEALPTREVMTLVQVVQSLTNDKLLVPCNERDGTLAWRWRAQEEAEKYKLCSTKEQTMVYSIIDDYGAEGVWSQTAQKRLGMHENIFKAALKQLMAKGLIAQFKSVENPNKKMYIKASIRPSEKATGGPWYTDQYLDEAFIEDLERVIYDFVKRHSTYMSRSVAAAQQRALQPKKGTVKGVAPAVGTKSQANGNTTTTTTTKKRTADEISDAHGVTVTVPVDSADTPHLSTSAPLPQPKPTLLQPLPAGFMGYPTVRDIARVLSQAGITTSTILSEEDVQKLVDVLEYDGLIERVRVAGKIGYRTLRPAHQSTEPWAVRTDQQPANTPDPGEPSSYNNAYTEVPCGQCPVFDLCEDGGPVRASNCEYFQKWLGHKTITSGGSI